MRLKNKARSTTTSKKHSRRISYLIMFWLVLVLVGFFSSIVTTNKVFASGGVGSGGSGSGGGGVPGACTNGLSGHWTRCGWGWAVYGSGGPGPTSGFRDGTAWSSVQSTCRNSGAASVYIFIIYDAGLNGMGYDYKSVEDGPPQYMGHFTAGTVVDNGRATAIDSSQAQNAFNSLGNYGVDTSGYSFGTNVSWFCYDFSPPADVCPNLPGNQSSVPPGMIKDSSGNCVTPPPPDACPNIPGNQSSVPPGMHKDGSGNCVSDCANNGSIPNFPYVTISTPDKSPGTTPAPGGYGPYGARYTQYTRDNNTQATATDDISNPTGPNGKIGNPNFRLPVTNQSYQQVTVNYQPFVDTYPYDYNQANVSYDSYWHETYWSATGQEYSHYVTVCDSYDANGNCTSSHQVKVIDGYGWVQTGGPTQKKTNNTVNGPLMNPCYDRGFKNVTPQTDKPYFDDEENPSKVTFGSRVSVDLYLPNGNKALRDDLKVKLDISADFYVKHADGTITRPWPQPKLSGQLSGNNILFDSGSYQPTTYTKNFTDEFNATIPPLKAGDMACFTIKALQLQGTMKPDGTRTSASGTAGPTPENCSAPLVDKPYLKVYGNDVFAGGAFTGGNCAQSATISTFYRTVPKNSTPGNVGSSSQFAAMATGSITQFASAQLRSTPPTPVKGLSFANVGVGGTFGGNFGGSHCIVDAFGTRPESAPAPPGGNTVNLAAVPTGAYSQTGTVTINAGTIPAASPGRRIALYVVGDVIISSDIKYANTNWATVNDIPAFYLIVEGNIYVQNNVSQLDGVYFAQPDPSRPNSGRIATCANGTTPYSASQIYASCHSTLTINGTFAAAKVNFLRSFSSLRYGTKNEFPLAPSPSHKCQDGPVVNQPVCAGEIFNFSPEAYLAEPFIMTPTGSATTGKYDYIVSLPPVL